MTANRRTSGQWWRVDGFIKARNSQQVTPPRSVRMELGAILSELFVQAKARISSHLIERTNVHNKIIGFNGTYLDINGSICKDIFSRQPLFVRIFYAKINYGTDANLPGLLRGGQSKSNDHSKDLGRTRKGFLNKRAFNKQTTSGGKRLVCQRKISSWLRDNVIGWIPNKKPDWLFVQFLWKMKSIWSMCPLRDLLDPPSFCRWTKVQLSARLGKPCSSWFKSLAL